MRGPSPILRGALARTVRAPVWAGLLTMAAALLVASLVAPTYFARAAQDAALQQIRSAAEEDTFRVAAVDLRATWSGRLTDEGTAALRSSLDALPGFGTAEVTSFGNGPTRSTEPVLLAGDSFAGATLWARDDALEVLGGDPGEPGVWVPSSVAEELDVAIGDEVRLAVRERLDGSRGRTFPLRVLGTFEPAPGSLLPRQVLDLGVRDVDLPLIGYDAGPLVLAITDHATLDRAGIRIGNVPRHVADLALEPDLGQVAAARASRAQRALQREAYDVGSPLAAALAEAKPGASQLQLATDLPDVLDDAESVTTTSRAAVAPFARATQVMSLLLLVAVYALWARSRTAESWTLTGWGLGPLRRGVLAALEVLPCAVVAAPVGAALAVAGVSLAGPPGRLGMREVVTQTAITSVSAALLVLALAAGMAAAGTLAQEREASRGFRSAPRRVPWALVWVSVAVVVAVAVLALDVDQRATSPLATVFPLATGAGVATAVMWIAQALPRPRRGREGTVAWLALRRSATSRTTAATAVLAIGLTVLGYGLAVRDGVSLAVADKAAALAGASTRIDVGEQLVGRSVAASARLAGPDAAVVYRRSVTLPPEFGEQPLLMADPVALASAVDWGARLEETGRAALAELGREHDPDDPVPILLAGTTDGRAGDRVTLTFSGLTRVDAVVVAAVDAFPGSESENGVVTVVAPTGPLVAALPRPFRPSTPYSETVGAGVFSAGIWSSAPAAKVQQQLDEAGLVAEQVALLDQARARPDLLSADWAVGYLLPLGLAAGCLVVGTGLLLARRLLERDRVSDVLMRHMGWTWGALSTSRMYELLATLALAGAAAVVATLVLALGPTVVETSAVIPPVARPALTATGVAWWLASWVVVALAAAVVLGVGGTRRRAGEVLRDQR